MEPDVQAAAEPSPAEFEVPTGPARDQWLRTGQLPKKEEAAASDAPKVEKVEVSEGIQPESAAEPETAKESQEQKDGDKRAGSKLSAEDRIRQLNAEKKAEKARADTLEARIQALERGKDAKQVESSPTTPANYEEWKKSFDPDAWIEEWTTKNPDQATSYGRAQLALSDHVYQIRRSFESRDQMLADLDKKWQTQISELGKLYPDDQEAATKVNDAAGRIANDPKVPLVIKQYTADSEIIGHLLYALTEKQLDQFIELSKSNPRQALKNLVLIERETEQLLKAEKVADTPRNERGQFVPEKKAPAKQVSDAPPPAKEVGGKGTTSGDELEQAVKDDDLDSFRAIANRRDIARRKGQ